MAETLALTIVVLFGVYLCGLAMAAFFQADRAKKFLLGFASSARAHYAEMFARLVVGAAFVVGAPRMLLPGVFGVFGWIILVTTGVLLVLPWTLHRRFAEQTVPRMTRFIALVGLFSLVMGGFIVAAVVAGGSL